MKNKTNKRAFTIVELVIVIAVIAILAAVLIPTFSNLVKKAQVSSDTQLVRNLNTSLKTDEALNGKHNTMQEALDAVYKSGFDLAKIMNTKATENTILWDSKNDVFCYLNGDEVVYLPESTTGNKLNNGDYQLWKIYSTVSEMEGETYSAYLTGEGWASEITVDGKGLDVGNVTGITSVNYNSDSSNEVTIRTNSFDTVLNVNALNATVRHFDKAKLVDITKVAGNSYHEYGEVQGNIELKNGRVVMESGSKSAAIKVTATVADIESGAVTISVDNTASSEVAVVVSQDVKTAIDNKGGDNKITAKEEQIITDSTVIENMSKFAGGLGTKDSPYLISNIQQWLSFAEQSSSEMNTNSYSVIADLDFSDTNVNSTIYYFNGSIDFNNKTIKGLNENNVDNNETGYLFQEIGNNASFSNLNFFASNCYDANGAIMQIGLAFMAPYYLTNANITFKNINVYGNISAADNNSGLILNWLVGVKGSVLFENCNNYCNMINSGYTAAFLGLAYGWGMVDIEVTFRNCNNYGTLISTNNDCCMLVSNPTRHKGDNLTLNVENCKNYGKIYAAPGQDANLAFNYSNGGLNYFTIDEIKQYQESGKIINMGLEGAICGNITSKELTISEGKFDIISSISDLSNVSKIELSFQFQGTGGLANGGVTSYAFAIPFEDLTTVELYAYEWKNVINKNGTLILQENLVEHELLGTIYYTYTENDITYYAYNIDGCWMGINKPVVNLVAYNSEGDILLVGYYQYK